MRRFPKESSHVRGRTSALTIGLTIFVVAVASLITVKLVASRTPAGEKSRTANKFPAYRAPRTADGKADLGGIWQALVTADIDVADHDAQAGPHPEVMGAYGAWPGGQGIVEEGEIPYRPEALAQKKANVDKRMLVNMTNDPSRHNTGDPELKCFRPGIPRANYMPFPFQIIQGRDSVVIVYEFADSLRTIYMDEKKEPPADSWMGWSTGHWEGDSLVVKTTGFVPYTWFDRAGDYHSDALHVEERYTPASPYHILYEATIEDPKVFTRPWKVQFPLYRRMEKNIQLMDFNCVEFVEGILYDRYRKHPNR
jgi:hypothetical protein